MVFNCNQCGVINFKNTSFAGSYYFIDCQKGHQTNMFPVCIRLFASANN